jgi:hypothetical protein
VVVPAQKGFRKVFLGENAWYAVRIARGMLPRIKYIAAYQSQPVSAVTHVAPVASIEPYGESGKYKIMGPRTGGTVSHDPLESRTPSPPCAALTGLACRLDPERLRCDPGHGEAIPLLGRVHGSQ